NPRLYWNDAVAQTGDIDQTYSPGPSFAKYDSYGSSVTLDWNITDSLAFKSITGFRQIDWRVGIDLDGSPESIQEVSDHQFQHQASQEFQINGRAFDDRLNYVGGLYYFHEAGFVHDFVPFEGILYIYDAGNDIDTNTYAAFIHADYSIGDKIGLTLGGRYTIDRKKFIGGQEDLNGFTYRFLGCAPPSAVLNPVPFGPPGGIPNPEGAPCAAFGGFPDPSHPLLYFPPGQLTQTFKEFTPTVGLQYHFSDDVMGYVSWSKGFKAGGWTTRLSQPVADGNAVAFDPEHSKTTEVGLKSEWLSNHLLANFALFYTDYNNIQLNVQTGASPVYLNAGDARMKGAEIQLQSLIGKSFSLNFAGGYIDAYYTFVDPTIGIPQHYDLATGLVFDDPLSAKLPKTPKYKLTLSPTYDIGLANSGTVRLAADYTYTAEMYNDALNTPELRRPPTHNLNASVHYLSPSTAYEVVLGGTNLTDERYITVGSVNYAAGEIASTYNPPREVYLGVRVNLGPGAR
ncbi:MAG TPA: TonB-dependent receptor, partial [Gammaproteobacteria bacterium]|nr:TonB-dependent receptor [Gammaproteobacteria bacterium]